MENNEAIAGTIANIGNTCCINTFIQCIAHIPSLNSYIVNKVTKSSELFNQLQDVLKIIWTDKNNVCHPHRLVHVIYQTFPDILTPGHQHDISEILTLIRDKISIELGRPYTYDVHKTNDILNKINECMYHYNDGKTSKLIKNIQNAQLSILNCNNTECDFQQINVEVYTTLMLDINDLTDFNNIISNYFKKELVHDWTCDKCKTKNNADKYMKLWNLPYVLIIVLKRFKYSDDGRFHKINNYIDIPENITFGKGSILKHQDLDYSYNLKAIGNHIGSYGGGHYYAFCKTNDGWYAYDDNNSTKLNKLNFDNAYVLFYERV